VDATREIIVAVEKSAITENVHQFYQNTQQLPLNCGTTFSYKNVEMHMTLMCFWNVENTGTSCCLNFVLPVSLSVHVWCIKKCVVCSLNIVGLFSSYLLLS